MAVAVNLIWGHREAIYFRMTGWTGFRESRVICPSGSHTAHHTREILRGLQVGWRSVTHHGAQQERGKQ